MLLSKGAKIDHESKLAPIDLAVLLKQPDMVSALLDSVGPGYVVSKKTWHYMLNDDTAYS